MCLEYREIMIGFGNRLVITMMCGLLGASALIADGSSIDDPDRGELICDQAGTLRVELSNGLELIIISTPEYDARDVQAWLLVRAGSLYETDSERGAAIVIEQSVRLGTTNYSQAQIDELLLSESVGYGMHPGSFVGFDHVGFMASVDRDDAQGLSRVFGFFGEVLDHDLIVLDEQRVRDSVGLVIDGIRDEPNADLRVRHRWLPTVMHGTPFGERMPRAPIDEIQLLSVSSVQSFADMLYHPGQSTLIVLGDVNSDEIIQAVNESIGSVERGEITRVADGRSGIDVSMRAALVADPGIEQGQAAMIWFRDTPTASTGRWSELAQRYDRDQMREMVVLRVAGEIVRHRIGQLSVRELGVEVDAGVDQVDLWGQIELMQLALEYEGSDWEASMRFLVQQCDRLYRDGATDDEVARARRSVLARWHRQADDWVELSSGDRMGLVHWLITSGRPMIDMVRWDRLATELMVGIGDGEINQQMRLLVNPSKATYVGLVSRLEEGLVDDGSALYESTVLGVVADAIRSPIDAIANDWMEQLSSSLLDEECTGGEICEVSVHQQAGVWDTKLGNGVRVWIRAIPESADARVYLSATLWGSVLDKIGARDDEIDAALMAWRNPATEGRSTGAIASFIAEHDLRVRARREIGHLQLNVDGPSSSMGEVMELMYVLLDRPMIERGVYEKWQGERVEIADDPVDLGLDVLYGSRVELDPEPTTLDSAQRLLTQIVRNGRIDIGISGAIDVEETIEQASSFFGALVRRDAPDLAKVSKGIERSSVMRGGRMTRVISDDEFEHGVVFGFVGDMDQPIGELRSLILSSMVFNKELSSFAESVGFEGDVRVSMASADVLAGRMIILIRVRCEEVLFEDARRLVFEGIERMIAQGVHESEFDEAKAKVDGSIAQYFDTPMFWSQRLGALGVRGRRVDDLWGIRQGYASVEPRFAGKVFEELMAGDEQFEIEIVGGRD